MEEYVLNADGTWFCYFLSSHKQGIMENYNQEKTWVLFTGVLEHYTYSTRVTVAILYWNVPTGQGEGSPDNSFCLEREMARHIYILVSWSVAKGLTGQKLGRRK